jgi:hypothetical protein
VTFVFLGSDNGRIHIWSTLSGNEIKVWQTPNSTEVVSVVRWNPRMMMVVISRLGSCFVCNNTNLHSLIYYPFSLEMFTFCVMYVVLCFRLQLVQMIWGSGYPPQLSTIRRVQNHKQRDSLQWERDSIENQIIGTHTQREKKRKGNVLHSICSTQHTQHEVQLKDNNHLKRLHCCSVDYLLSLV